MDRREFFRTGVLGATCGLTSGSLATGFFRISSKDAVPAFELDEITVAQLQDAMRSGKYTSRRLCELYISRIEALDRSGPTLRSVIETNPEAMDIAARMDAERKTGRVRGPLHGVPVLIKDNIATADRMATTAGSLALVGSRPPRDAFVAQRLRDAGAVILGKTNLSEWANFRSTHSVSGWSGRGGLCRSAYALDRNPCGSSSGTGVAIAANFATLGVGTETDGSVVCPSGANALVGIKPTIGLVSRSGIVPISHSQDTAGPICRTVTDAAILLGVLGGVDPRDTVTQQSPSHVEADYSRYLNPAALRGARIGVARTRFFGYSAGADHLVEQAIAVMKSQGAEIVDPADIPHTGEYDDSELTVMLYEFKADLNTYLADLGPGSLVHNLAELIAFNETHRAEEMPYFGQELFESAQKKGALTDDAYVEALARNHRLSRTEGLDVVLAEKKLDAIIAPTGGPPWTTDLVNGDHFTGSSSTPAAVAGYPSITIPVGQVFGLPVGMSFIGAPWSEGKLIGLAYACEQVLRGRKPPQFLATADFSH
jgi:amidase